jgi:protein TonB
LSTSIIFGGGALLTYMVFYLIPLMQKLDADRKKEEVALAPPVKAPEEKEYTPPPEEQPEEPPPPPPEMSEASSDIPVDIPDIPMPSGGMGRILVNVKPRVRIGEGGGMDTGGVDTEPTVSSRAQPNLSNSLRIKIKKKGGVQAEITALVDENGRVLETKVSKSSGISGVDQGLMNTVTRYKFRPAIRNGRKAKAKVRIPFNLRF